MRNLEDPLIILSVKEGEDENKITLELRKFVDLKQQKGNFSASLSLKFFPTISKHLI